MGLLDALSSDDAKLGIALLSASGYSPTPMSFGQRLGGALGQVQADKASALKLKLLQSQMDENASQNQLRQAQIGKMTADQAFMSSIGQRLNGGGGAPASGAPGPGGSPGMGGMGAPGVAGTQQVGANAFPLTFGETVMAKLRGHDLMDAYKYANEPQELKPGSLYRNRMTGQSESLPTVNAAGQGTQTIADPTAPGGYRIIVPNGAADAYKTFKDIDAGVSSGSKLIKVYNNATKQDDYLTEAEMIALRRAQQGQGGGNPPSAPMARPGTAANMRGGFTGTPDEIMGAINSYPEPVRAQMRQAYVNQTTGNNPAFDAMGTGALPPSAEPAAGRATYAAGPSAADTNRIAADKEYQTKVAGDQTEQRKSIMNAGFTAGSKIAKLQQIDKLLGDFDGGKLSQTALDFSSAANSLGIKLDKNLPNKEAALAMSREIALSLRDPSSGAGMPGAMSDADRNFLSSMTPDIGQTAQGRKQIISTAVAVQQRNQQVAGFARKYEEKYGKLDNGFYDQLSKWSEANPMFGGAK